MEKNILNKEDTTNILKQFFEECKKFWIREGKTEKESYMKAIKDIQSIQHDPNSPCGDLLNRESKTDFIHNKLETYYNQ